MKHIICSCLDVAPGRSALCLLAAMAITGVPAHTAAAAEGETQAILRSMADYVGRQDNLSLEYAADVEVVTPAVMAEPGEQFVIRRRAQALIKPAFDENGIRLAVPTVPMAGREETEAAAARQVLSGIKGKPSEEGG